jgi:hypothetical protein
MANALTTRMNDGSGHGPYRLADQPIYKAFQTASQLKPVDGWPGKGTMAMLQSVLATVPMPMPAVTIYPWKKKPGWKPPNAPLLADWNAP